MTPLDLRKAPPRGAREELLGFYFLARTIDKLRAELPGGNLGGYVNHDTGFSAWVVRRLGLNMDELRAVVAAAPNEEAVVRWLTARVEASAAPALNEKFETFVVERMSAEDRELVRSRHPVMADRADLSKILDVLEADDAREFPSS
ncbi:MAG TPA: DUF5069 domain-containing protein [Candidatus Cybelea sp.]|jgi:hypothetical protein|nr:DUF5069 domain-containing protein [Candidatus Cybelea sp.]